jgi:probable F420-dependent oxidoreductase
VDVCASLDPQLPLSEVAAVVRRLEALGVDAVHVPETVHDSLAVALLAVEHTTRVTVRTAVTLAFVRSPTLVAYAAWDLRRLSQGRFELGLGSQIRQNVEDRYGMPWTEPTARMRDYVTALHALFAAFQSGSLVPVESDSYRLTRLQPYFNPGPCEHGAPPVWLGAVNAGMCSVAGDLAVGVITHPTNSTPSHIASVVRPALGDRRLLASATVATGPTASAVAAERERQRRLLAFLYSTPSYRPQLERQGWPSLQPQLAALTRTGDWEQLSSVLTDDHLDVLLLTGTYESLPQLVHDRFGGLVDGVVLPAAALLQDEVQAAAAVAALRS